jgi:hypothetical protein
MIIYECPLCGYIDSDKEMAHFHCVDADSKLWL